MGEVHCLKGAVEYEFNLDVVSTIRVIGPFCVVRPLTADGMRKTAEA